MAGDPGGSTNDGVVLVVEDDDGVRQVVVELLERDGFQVAHAESVKAAETILESADVMLALIDLKLRDGNGLELVKRLSLDPLIGTIIMSGASDEMDRIIGYEVGADDYITKPFNNRELTARLRRHAARLRFIREQTVRDVSTPGSTTLGPWTIDESRRAVFHSDGVRAVMSDAEFRTLLCLWANRGAVMSRDALYREVVGPGPRDPLDRRIDVYVSGLRRKLKLKDPYRIRTIHGIGYILD